MIEPAALPDVCVNYADYLEDSGLSNLLFILLTAITQHDGEVTSMP